MNHVEVSAVIPVFNDREALERAIPQSLSVLEKITDRFELIVAEDGSTDGSTGLVREWERHDHRVRLFHSDERLGRGKALNRAFSSARGEIVCYYDVDLATDMRHLPDLIDAIRRGADVATGSRLMKESDVARTAERDIASRGYNALVRLALNSRLHDHQCGFKGFRKQSLMKLLPKIQAEHWFWDTEVLVQAQRAGYAIREFPVRWRPGRGTTVKPRDVWEMGSDIVRLWRRLHVEKS
ncbi:MAG: glycosyltransferase [Methanomicrobiaceae archaeon]|nr:glycosyltransferase [Methanomicrobiaceae archaeon]